MCILLLAKVVRGTRRHKLEATGAPSKWLCGVQFGKQDEELMDLNGRNHGVLKRGVQGTQGREEGALAFPQPGEEPEVNAPPQRRTQAQDCRCCPLARRGELDCSVQLPREVRPAEAGAPEASAARTLVLGARAVQTAWLELLSDAGC